MKHSPLFIAISITLSALYLTGCDKENAEQDAAAAQQQKPTPVVNVMPVRFQTVPLIEEFAGRTVAYEEAEVRPQATGIIDQILYREGSMVKKGQPLYRLSMDNYQYTQAANAAALQQAQANVGTANADYSNAVANYNAQLAQLEQARVDLQRLEKLVNMQAISQQQYDQAMTNFKTAQAAVASAEAAIEQSRANIASAEAAASTAEARLSGSNIDLNRTIVRAPISGKTSRSNVTAGTLVNANQSNALVNISKLNPIYVDISQSSADLLKLKQQQASGAIEPGSRRVELILEDGSVYPVRGQLLLEEAKVDEQSGSVTLRAVFPNDNYLLLPGMFVNARLTQGLLTNAVLVPQSALIRTPKGDTQVYVADPSNKLQVKPVTVNGTYRGNWVVTDGLQSRDKVVVLGGSGLQPEQEVVVKPLPPTADQMAAQQGIMPNNGQVMPQGQGPVAPQPASQTSSQVATPSNGTAAPNSPVETDAQQ